MPIHKKLLNVDSRSKQWFFKVTAVIVYFRFSFKLCKNSYSNGILLIALTLKDFKSSICAQNSNGTQNIIYITPIVLYNINRSIANTMFHIGLYTLQNQFVKHLQSNL